MGNTKTLIVLCSGCFVLLLVVLAVCAALREPPPAPAPAAVPPVNDAGPPTASAPRPPHTDDGWTVLAPTGAPVANADVTVVYACEILPEDTVLFATRTGRDGKFPCPDRRYALPAGEALEGSFEERIELRVHHPHYVNAAYVLPARRECDLSDLRQAVPLKIALLAGLALEGLVVDQAGAPLAGARVHVTNATHLQPEAQRFAAWKETVQTEAAGRFSVRVPGARVLLDASADGYLRSTGLHVQTEGLIRIELQRGMRLTGTVKELEGDPVPGVRILAISYGSRAHVLSDEKGEFALDGLVDDLYAFLEIVTAAKGFRERRFELEPPLPAHLDIAIERVPRLRALLVDQSTREPLRNVRVFVSDFFGEYRTDAEGVLVFDEPFPVGTRGEYRLLPDGYLSSATRYATVGRQALIDIGTVAVAKSPELIVRVVDETGTPVEGAEVEEDEENRALTGADGVATLRNFSDREEDIEIRKGERRSSLRVSFVFGEQRKTLQIVLGPSVAERSTCVIRGFVRSNEGEPIPGAHVYCTVPRGSLPFFDDFVDAETAADGRYELKTPPKIDDVVLARALGLRTAMQTLQIPETEPWSLDIDFVLTPEPPESPGLRVRGIVLDAGGGPVSGAEVCLEPIGDGRGGYAKTAATGLFECECFAPGSYTLTATHNMLCSDPVTVEVGAEAPSELEVRLPATRTISIKVVSERGEPVPDASVRLHGMIRGRMVETSAWGGEAGVDSFEVAGDPVDLGLDITCDGYADYTFACATLAELPVEVTLRPVAKERMCVLEGTVLTPGGRVFSGREVEYSVQYSRDDVYDLVVMAPDETLLGGCSYHGSGGNLSASIAARGPATVWVEFRGMRSNSYDLNLEEGATISGLCFQLAAGAAEVAVLVVDEHGAPLPVAKVRLEGRRLKLDATCGAAGCAYFENVPEGHATLSGEWPENEYSFSDSEYKRGSRIVSIPGPQPFVLKLAPARAPGWLASIAGTITPQEPGVKLLLDRNNGGDDWTLVEKKDVGDDGTFRFAGLAPGRYALTAAGRSRYGAIELALAKGEMRRVQLELRESVEVRGRILLDDAPLPGGELALRGDVHFSVVISDGAAVREVPPGEYQLEVESFTDNFGAERLKALGIPTKGYGFVLALGRTLQVTADAGAEFTHRIRTGTVRINLLRGGVAIKSALAEIYPAGRLTPCARRSVQGGIALLHTFPAGAYLVTFVDASLYSLSDNRPFEKDRVPLAEEEIVERKDAPSPRLASARITVEAGVTRDVTIDVEAQCAVSIAVDLPGGAPAQSAFGVFSVDGGPQFTVYGKSPLAFSAPEGTLAGSVGTDAYEPLQIAPFAVRAHGENLSRIEFSPGGGICIPVPAEFDLPAYVAPADAGSRVAYVTLSAVPLHTLEGRLPPDQFAALCARGLTKAFMTRLLPAGRYTVTSQALEGKEQTIVDVRAGTYSIAE